jgi:hypothetical protein
MANPMSEAGPEAPRLDMDRRLTLRFRGFAITSDAGLRGYRELDDSSGLTDVAADVLADARTYARLQLSGSELEKAEARRSEGRVAPRRTLPRASASPSLRARSLRGQPSASSPSTISAARRSNGSGRARARSCGSHADTLPPTPPVSSSTRWPTTLAISCGHRRCPRRRNRGR